MKKQLFIIIILITSFCSNLHAQSLAPEVVVSGGDNFTNGTGMLSWSLGEIAIETLANSSGSLSQGFFDADIDITASTDLELSIEEVEVYPNPVQNELIIEKKSSEKVNFSYTLIDVNGRIISTNSITSNKESINMANVNSGTYVLKVHSNDKSNTYKILKK